MPQKHAYLIMAHGNLKVLSTLLRLLDDEKNDIYIHIDKKVKNFNFKKFSLLCKKSHVFYTPKRLNVKWGEFSQIKNEIQLYETATKNGPYKYYHLLSGVDLPLKSQQEIHAFFNTHNEEFICFTQTPTIYDYHRLSRYRFHAQNSFILSQIVSFINILQDKWETDRFKKYNLRFAKGYNWCSLTHNAVNYILSNKKLIYKMCKYSSCADECYKQILLLNSDFQNTIFTDSLGKPNDFREVDWLNGDGNSPHIYTLADLEKLKSSQKFFARKFDENLDFNIIKEIEKIVINRGK